MSGEILLRLLGLITVEPGSRIIVQGKGRACIFRFNPGLAAALTALTIGASEADAFAHSLKHHPQAGGALRSALGQLQKQGLLSTVLSSDGLDVAACLPFGAYTPPTDYNPAKSYRLSRFAYLQADSREGGWLLQTPLAPVVVRLNADGFNLLGQFQAHAGELTPDLNLLSRVLAAACMLTDAASPEEDQPPLGAWSFSNALDFALARDSRRNWQGAAVGPDTFEPKVQPAADDAAIPLAVTPPSQPGLLLRDALTLRQSRRQHGVEPITLDQLGYFLDQSARSLPASDRSEGPPMRLPYPSAGGLYPLEIYVVVNRCEALSGIVYHYRPETHMLEPWVSPVGAAERLLNETREVTYGQPTELDVLLLITARGENSLLKYGSAALSLMNQDAGALIQTFYLAAESLGLAGCAIGAFEAASVEKLLDFSQWLEIPIGLFWIGNRYHEKP